MKTQYSTLLILFFASFFLLIPSVYGQSKCDRLNEGIELFNANNYSESITSFKEVKSNSKKGDDCYVDCCLWLAKSNFKTNPKSFAGSNYLAKSLSLNDIHSLRYYALEYPYYDMSIGDYIDEKAMFEMYDDGEVFFLLGNIYAKTSYFEEDKLFDNYLSKAIENGFNDQSLFSNNFIKRVNKKRYLEVIGVFEVNIKRYVELSINHWQKKDKFEKNSHLCKKSK